MQVKYKNLSMIIGNGDMNCFQDIIINGEPSAYFLSNEDYKLLASAFLWITFDFLKKRKYENNNK